MQLLLNYPLLAYKMERFGRLLAEHYLVCFEDRIKLFILKSPEERYLDLLQYEKDVLERIPQHYIAKYIGITPVSLSRIRRRIFSLPNAK
ncbi:MAG: hypothetical protein K2W79_12185 [Hydrotalea flava]|uniref:hypothetical protein n=1 Tax=Hydrotalea TaxID=1004300 RepID=UPI001C45FF1B|nr:MULTISPECIES: hypothetical protein [Hydrotalea]MBY0349010.1 hypothetical protein [Hydrotalea flava]